MSQHLGASRMATTFSVPQDADERLQQMLALYKSPATIRDMKQVFFYVDACSQTTNIDPLQNRFNIIGGEQIFGLPDSILQNYYDRIGTTREFNISDHVNDLMDIRVPKDKYVIEINLAECAIESDLSAWETIPDRVLIKTEPPSTSAPFPQLQWYASPTFKLGGTYAEQATAGSQDGITIPVQLLDTPVQQATKVSEPQTLYTRIKQLDNGQPYNWAITNSGQGYSIDKSHQLLVRHGDVDYNKLTLEFGHLNLKKDETDHYNRQPKYFDYNEETWNRIEPASKVNQNGDELFGGYYGEFPRPDGAIDPNLPNFVNPDGSNLKGYVLSECERKELFYTSKQWTPSTDPQDLGQPAELYVQGKPLFFNQQVSKLSFRFMIRLIHMF